VAREINDNPEWMADQQFLRQELDKIRRYRHRSMQQIRRKGQLSFRVGADERRATYAQLVYKLYAKLIKRFFGQWGRSTIAKMAGVPYHVGRCIIRIIIDATSYPMHDEEKAQLTRALRFAWKNRDAIPRNQLDGFWKQHGGIFACAEKVAKS
jgi:hypothetical protein